MQRQSLTYFRRYTDSFSILFWDRGWCNPRADWCCRLLRIFQYPLWDRGWCNSFFGGWHLIFLFSFQYPLWDRGWCNLTGQLPKEIQTKNLSVSSLGSWVVQPFPCQERRFAACPFSILFGIVGGATAVQYEDDKKNWHFQYPLWDRGWCNQVRAWSTSGLRCLSVSSLGSWVVQLLYHFRRFCDVRAFSILFGIVGGATLLTWCRSASRRARLSVSSLGSWVVQRYWIQPAGAPGTTFSILFWDRGWCNRYNRLGEICRPALSVSSLGSWVVQPQFYRKKTTFSCVSGFLMVAKGCF